MTLAAVEGGADAIRQVRAGIDGLPARRGLRREEREPVALPHGARVSAPTEEDEDDEDDEDKKRDEKVEIQGTIEAVGLDADGNLVSITVDGQTVAIGSETDVRGTIEVGASVEIAAVRTDDGIVARNVRIQDDDDDDDDEGDDSGSG
ncbi:MAG: hypothetical protein IIA54_06775 [Chloroflexi bacterium]|nr:hypothetical protein [Chloroflexota bacterium]